MGEGPTSREVGVYVVELGRARETAPGSGRYVVRAKVRLRDTGRLLPDVVEGEGDTRRAARAVALANGVRFATRLRPPREVAPTAEELSEPRVAWNVEVFGPACDLRTTYEDGNFGLSFRVRGEVFAMGGERARDLADALWEGCVVRARGKRHGDVVRPTKVTPAKGQTRPLVERLPRPRKVPGFVAARRKLAALPKEPPSREVPVDSLGKSATGKRVFKGRKGEDHE